MCNFHEAVAVKAATDPATGVLHPGHKVVIQLALSRYWAERYIEGGDEVNGYNPYPLAMTAQQEAFARSGLKRPVPVLQDEEGVLILRLRAKIQKLEDEGVDFRAKALRLPLSTARASFISHAVSLLYQGDPKGVFTVRPDAPEEALAPLHRIVRTLHADEDSAALLEALVKNKIGQLYGTAPQEVNTALIRAFERLPDDIRALGRSVSRYGGNIVLGGFSGLIGHAVHYGSVLGTGLAAGAASQASLALSGLFMGAAYAGWYGVFGGRYESAKQKITALAVQGGLTLAILFGAQSMVPHAHLSSEKMAWFENLPKEMQEELVQTEQSRITNLPEDLRERLKEAADQAGLTPELYLLTCNGEDPVTQQIEIYIKRHQIMDPNSGLNIKVE